MGRLRRVRSRNGKMVPFKQSAIADSIREAVSVCGEGDDILADELAGVVTLFLEKHYDDDEPPSLEDIRDMVHKVLVETGHGRLARSYKRLGGRGEVPVGVDEGGELRRDATSFPDVLGLGETTTPFDHGRLARSLVRRLGVAEAEARVVAHEVGARLHGTGLDRVTTALVREHVRVALAAAGNDAAASRLEVLGVTRRQIEAWVFPAAPSDPDPEEACARGVLEAFSFGDVFERETTRAHRDARIHVFGAGHPHRVEAVTLDASGPVLEHAGSPDGLLLELAGLLPALAPLVRRRVVLSNTGVAWARITRRSRRSPRAFVQRLFDQLNRVDVFGRPIYPPLVLEVGLDEGSLPLAEALIGALETPAANTTRLGVEFVISSDEWPDSALVDRVLRVVRRHRESAVRLASAEAGAAAPNQVLLDIGAVGVNVPLALVLADVQSLDDVSAALSGPAGLAVDALFEKYWFLRRASPETLRGLMARLPGGDGLRIDSAGQGGHLLLWGLPQALAYLEAIGVSRVDERATVLARLLSFVDYVAGEDREAVRLDLAIGGVEDRAVRSRLLNACTEAAEILESRALSSALTTVPHDAPTLPLAPPLTDEANAPVLGGRFLERLGVGLPLPARGDDEIINAMWLKQLVAGSKLAWFQLEERGEPFEVQESLFTS